MDVGRAHETFTHPPTHPPTVSQQPFSSELLHILTSRRESGRVSDCAVHERVGEGWFVHLIVAMLSVAVEVDEDVFGEGLAVFDG